MIKNLPGRLSCGITDTLNEFYILSHTPNYMKFIKIRNKWTRTITYMFVLHHIRHQTPTKYFWLQENPIPKANHTGLLYFRNNMSTPYQPTFTCSKAAIETPKQFAT